MAQTRVVLGYGTIVQRAILADDAVAPRGRRRQASVTLAWGQSLLSRHPTAVLF